MNPSPEQQQLKVVALDIAGRFLGASNYTAKQLIENAAVVYGFLIEDTVIVYPDEDAEISS